MIITSFRSCHFFLLHRQVINSYLIQTCSCNTDLTWLQIFERIVCVLDLNCQKCKHPLKEGTPQDKKKSAYINHAMPVIQYLLFANLIL